jgi:hypothetical protein
VRFGLKEAGRKKLRADEQKHHMCGKYSRLLRVLLIKLGNNNLLPFTYTAHREKLPSINSNKSGRIDLPQGKIRPSAFFNHLVHMGH